MGDSSTSNIFVVLVAIFTAYLSAYFTIRLEHKKEMRTILDALLSEIEWNLNNPTFTLGYDNSQKHP